MIQSLSNFTDQFKLTLGTAPNEILLNIFLNVFKPKLVDNYRLIDFDRRIHLLTPVIKNFISMRLVSKAWSLAVYISDIWILIAKRLYISRVTLEIGPGNEFRNVRNHLTLISKNLKDAKALIQSKKTFAENILAQNAQHLHLLSLDLLLGLHEKGKNGHKVRDYTSWVNLSILVREVHTNLAFANSEKIYELAMRLRNGKRLAQNSEKAAFYFKIAAKKNHSDSQFQLGYIYEKGYGKRVNPAKAITWYETAAEAGQMGAITQLSELSNYHNKKKYLLILAETNHYSAYIVGMNYINGSDGFEQSMKKGMEFLKKAAENILNAQLNLAKICFEAQSYTEAFNYWKMASDQYSDPQANYNLGTLSVSGKGVPQSYEKAVEYWQKGVDKGHHKSLLQLAIAYQSGKGVEKSNQVAIELLISFLNPKEKSLILESLDIAIAEYILGLAYSDEGLHIQAMESWNSSYEKEHLDAGFQIGLSYHMGRGVSVQLEVANVYFEQLSKKNHPQAKLFLGIAYSKGLGLKQDAYKAFELWNQAAEMHILEARYLVGKAYSKGFGCTKDEKIACEQWTIAANQGHTHSQYALAKACYEGIGTHQDKEKAKELLQDAGQNGLEKAKDYLFYIEIQEIECDLIMQDMHDDSNLLESTQDDSLETKGKESYKRKVSEMDGVLESGLVESLDEKTLEREYGIEPRKPVRRKLEFED